jgi:site-specific recombinase XerC
MINRITFKTIAKPSKSDPTLLLIYIRVTIKRTPYYLNTYFKIMARDWNKDKGEVRLSNKNAYQINNSVRKLINKMEELVMQWNAENKIITFKDLQQLFVEKKVVESEQTFTDFFKEELAKKNDIDAKTKEKYQRTLRKFVDFKPIVNFVDIDLSLVQEFESYLINQKQSPNTRKKNHQILGYFINQGIAKGKISKNPYAFFTKPKKDTSREFLTAKKVEKLENYTFNDAQKYLEKTRDIFLFGCYTGLRESDLSSLNREHLTIEDDKVILKMRMEKSRTGKFISLRLHQLEFRNPIPLLRKYLKEDDNSIFPKLSNPQTNRNLAQIMDLLHINKHITIHSSRHTFAVNTYAIIKDVLKLKKYLGHSKIETTMIYVKMYEELYI